MVGIISVFFPNWNACSETISLSRKIITKIYVAQFLCGSVCVFLSCVLYMMNICCFRHDGPGLEIWIWSQLLPEASQKQSYEADSRCLSRATQDHRCMSIYSLTVWYFLTICCIMLMNLILGDKFFYCCLSFAVLSWISALLLS